MKALDILNEVNGQLKRSRDYNRFNIEIQFNKTYQVKVEEAIKELEDLQNRKCGNCKHWHSKKVDHPNYRECNSEETFNLIYKETYCDFCCNKWESK